MSNQHARLGRRQMIGGCLGSAAALAVGTRMAVAADLPKLDESDATAKALAYVHDASTVPANTRGGDRICSGCQLYTGGDKEWGPCAIFPAKAVAAKGWCRSWVAKS